MPRSLLRRLRGQPERQSREHYQRRIPARVAAWRLRSAPRQAHLPVQASRPVPHHSSHSNLAREPSVRQTRTQGLVMRDHHVRCPSRQPGRSVRHVQAAGATPAASQPVAHSPSSWPSLDDADPREHGRRQPTACWPSTGACRVGLPQAALMQREATVSLATGPLEAAPRDG